MSALAALLAAGGGIASAQKPAQLLPGNAAGVLREGSPATTAEAAPQADREELIAPPPDPTVDEIYTALQPMYPTLSRTTVYNTVKLLTDAGCIRALNLDGDSTRYDFDTSPHGHFLCQECGMVFDVPFSNFPPPPEGFDVRSTQLSYKGVCPACLEK